MSHDPIRPISPPVDVDEYDYDYYHRAEEDEEYARDLLLEQQEREDFCECDEAYGYYGGDEY